MHHNDYKIQNYMQDTLANLTSSDPNMMYFDQTMNQPDRKEFLNTSIREVNSHCELKHWKLLPCARSPRDNLSSNSFGK